MRIKKIVIILFYGAGTILFVFFAFVISFNFHRDSRLLGVNYSNNNNLGDKEVRRDDLGSIDSSQEVEYETIVFEGQIIRNPTPSKEITDKQQVEDKDKNDKELDRTSKAKVLIYNNSGVPGLHDKLKTNIENLGFQVDLAQEEDKVRTITVIVQQTSDEYGLELLQFLKKGQLVEEIQENPAYDLLLVLGEDYIP
jgi:hypothetical protein